MEPEDLFGLFHKTPEEKRRDRMVLDTIQPSDFLPKPGDYFRMRFATYADRSYLDVIWKCLAFQDGAVLGEVVLGSTYGDKKKLFVVGDVLFYDANEIGAMLTSTERSAS